MNKYKIFGFIVSLILVASPSFVFATLTVDSTLIFNKNTISAKVTTAVDYEDYIIAGVYDTGGSSVTDTTITRKTGNFYTTPVFIGGLLNGANYIFRVSDRAGDKKEIPFQKLESQAQENPLNHLNLVPLNSAIEEANNLLANSVEGIKNGQYEVYSKTQLRIAVTSADLVNTSPYYALSFTQANIDKITADLNKAINIFKSKIIIKPEPPVPPIVTTNPEPPTTATPTKLINKIVPDCNVGPIEKIIDPVTGKAIGAKYAKPCDFKYVMELINNFITFLLFTIATPFIALILVYAGWLYLSSSASPKNIDTAKTIFKNALIGYVLALAAWLIVHTIMTSLGYTGPMYLTFIISKMFV